MRCLYIIYNMGYHICHLLYYITTYIYRYHKIYLLYYITTSIEHSSLRSEELQTLVLAMFAEHLLECRALAEQASEELERLKEAKEQDRPGLSAAAFSLLKQAVYLQYIIELMLLPCIIYIYYRYSSYIHVYCIYV